MIVELFVRRRWLTQHTSIGQLHYCRFDKSSPGQLVLPEPDCYTLEDETRAFGIKVPGKTAIPLGRYRLSVERSPKFSELAGHDVLTPRLHDVPGYQGILIHPGKDEFDTLGCILVSQKLGAGPDKLDAASSRPAYQALLNKLCADGVRELDKGTEAWITVEVDAAVVA